MQSESFIDYEKYKKIQTELKAAFKNQEDNAYFNYSHLWNNYFTHRDSINELSDLLISLNDRFKFIEGIADIRSNVDKNLIIEYYSEFLDKQLLQVYPMHWIGSPSVIDFQGLPASAAYLSNLRLFMELKSMLKNSELLSKPLDIVEIGAGYGGLAYFLLYSGIANSVTIIDLPENLRISAFFLTQIFKHMPYRIIASPNLEQQPSSGLNFVSAGNIRAISEWQFDLAVNTDSLGEMPHTTAKSYVKWIHEHLRVGGHFFSKNGHNRGRDCIKLPEEYGYDVFNYQALGFPTGITTLFDDFSHYAFLKKDNTKTNTCPAFYFNVLCALFALGLQEDLSELCLNYAQNQITDNQSKFLEVCNNYFSTQNITTKIKMLEHQNLPNELQSCINYLLGIAYYLNKNYKKADLLLSSFLSVTKSYIAEAYAIMILSKNDRKHLHEPFKFSGKTKYAIEEIRKYYNSNAIARTLALKLRADVLRKKINYPQNYSPSPLLKLKNIAFNLREGKGISIHR